MRLRSFSAIMLCASIAAVAAPGSRAVAQIEFAKSTLRVTSESQPSTPAARVSETAADVPQHQATNESDNSQVDDRQVPPATAPVRHQGVRPVNYEAPTDDQSSTIRHAPARVDVYTSTNAQATLNKMPHPVPVQPKPAPGAKRPRGKPFQDVQSEPAISPYLNMYRTDVNSNNLPNYFAFVKPQLDQIDANRQQAADLKKLRGQLQTAQAGGTTAQSPTMTAGAHYMDTAQFYRGMRK